MQYGSCDVILRLKVSQVKATTLLVVHGWEIDNKFFFINGTQIALRNLKDKGLYVGRGDLKDEGLQTCSIANNYVIGPGIRRMKGKVIKIDGHVMGSSRV